MKKGTKKFKAFQIIVWALFLTWIIFPYVGLPRYPWFFGTYFTFLFIIVFYMQIGTVEDIRFSNIKKISWRFVPRVVLASLIIVGLRLKVFSALKLIKGAESEIVVQIVGGMVSGLIGFLSAWRVYVRQQNSELKQKRKSYTEQLWFEIVHNMVILKIDIKSKVVFFRKLETNCWNATISSHLGIDGKVKGKFCDLYGELDFYNYLHQLQRMVLAQGTNPQLNGMITYFAQSIGSIVSKIEECSALLFGEMVRLGYREDIDWPYSEIDWKSIYQKFKEKNN